MHRDSTYKPGAHSLPLLGLLGLMASATVCAQLPAREEGTWVAPIENEAVIGTSENGNTPLLTADELEALVGPVALYPDNLLAIVLPASTYPLEIVQAARFLERFAVDSSLTPDENWDDSIVALLNYPEVVEMMNDDIDWAWKLGEAVVAQQTAVVAAVESFRDKAYAVGNLKSDEYQTVTKDGDIIEIAPVNEEVIYVPYYKPERVVVYSQRPVYHYYPRAYPLYYYPYTDNYHFGNGFFWGVTTAFTIGWASDYLRVYHHSYYGHPYYGHSYYGQHYRHSSINVHNSYYVNNHRRRSHDSHRSGDYWRPRHSGGARPGLHVARNHYYRGSEGGRHGWGDQSSEDRHSSTRNYRDGRMNGLSNNTHGQRSRIIPVNSQSRSASGVSQLDRGQSNTPRQSTHRSSTPKGNSEAIRLRVRDSSTTLRSAARASAPQRLIQKQASKSTAKGGKRSSLEVNKQRPVVQRSNRQTLARVNSRSRQAPARYQPRVSSSGRTAARNSRAQVRSHRPTNRMNHAWRN